jgi:hypothetical protein
MEDNAGKKWGDALSGAISEIILNSLHEVIPHLE